jgi:nucleotide-binding universal stress UspA family protein
MSQAKQTVLPVETILCPIDFSDPACAAVDRASELALHFGAELCVLSITPPPAPELGGAALAFADYMRESADEAEEKINALIAARVPPAVKARPVLGYGNVAGEIKRVAREENADLIVMATHGLIGWRHLIFDSVTDRTIQRTSCPVLSIHHAAAQAAKKMLPVRRILAPTDFSELSLAAIDNAVELANHFQAELDVLHVVPTLSEEIAPGEYKASEYDADRLSVARKQLCEMIEARTPKAVNARPLVRLGNAADEIQRAAKAENIDLIVIATHGATGWRHLVYGSVAERVLRLAERPVLTIHNDDGRTSA